MGAWYMYQTVDARGYARGKAEVRAEFDKFKIALAEEGRKAEALARQREAKDRKAKENADAENKRLRDDLSAARRRLRDNRARPDSGVVPRAAAGSVSPERAAFDRAELDRALRAFTAGVEELVGEGAEAIVDLDTAKKWAQ